MERRRLVIADDHPPTRAGVRYTFEQAGWEVCGEAGDAPGAIEAALRERPDACLLDVHMPGGGGIRAVREISEKLPGTAIVMLSVSREDDDVLDALRAGAAGYLLKDMDPDRMPFALEGVLGGEAALPRALVGRVLAEFRGRGHRREALARHRPSATLTAREWEVLELLAESASTADIAGRLYISEATVRSHVAAVLRKLGVADRQAAIDLLEEID
jgi:DNA-binding NarL/FixJ family response regulator